VRGGVDHHHVGTSRSQCCRAHLAGGAVGAVDGDAQAAQVGFDGAEQVLDVPVPGFTAVQRDRSDVGAGRQLPAAVQVRLDLVFVGIVEVDPAAGDELDAVVGHRVVRGGDHHREVVVLGTGQVGVGGGGQHTEVLHVHSGAGQASDHRRGQE